MRIITRKINEEWMTMDSTRVKKAEGKGRLLIELAVWMLDGRIDTWIELRELEKENETGGRGILKDVVECMQYRSNGAISEVDIGKVR